MTNVIYNINIPDGPNNPSQDQPKMKTNTNSISSLINIDHIGFGNNQGGYHLPIHQPALSTWVQATRTATPPLGPVPGVNEIIAMNVTPIATNATVDTQLFAMTGASNGTTNGVSQLTGANVNIEGYCWSGGLLFQWGFVNTPSAGTFAGGTANGTVTFKDRDAGKLCISFPVSCFMITATPTYFNGFTPQSFFPAAISISEPLSNTGFDWTYNSTKSGVLYNGFFWFAVGI